MQHLAFRPERENERSCISHATTYQRSLAVSTGISNIHIAVPGAVSQLPSVGGYPPDQGDSTILVISAGAPGRIGGPQWPVPRLT
jgi:hypothetical protein